MICIMIKHGRRRTQERREEVYIANGRCRLILTENTDSKPVITKRDRAIECRGKEVMDKKEKETRNGYVICVCMYREWGRLEYI
jgi:hypothetical protein